MADPLRAVRPSFKSLMWNGKICRPQLTSAYLNKNSCSLRNSLCTFMSPFVPTSPLVVVELLLLFCTHVASSPGELLR